MLALREAVDATVDHGYPVWVGGNDPAVREARGRPRRRVEQVGGGLRTFRAQAEGLRIAAVR